MTRAAALVGLFAAACGSPTPPAPAQPRPERTRLPAEVLQSIHQGAASLELPDAGVEVALVGRRDLPLVEAYLDGHGPYRLLVDLGSNVCIFRRDVIDEIGARVLFERETSDIVALHAMRVGGAVWHDVVGGAYDELDVDGVIGYNVLRDVTVSIDVPRQRFALSHRALPPANGTTILPFVVQGRMPYVRVALGDASVLMNFDTGASDWILLPSSWAARLALAAGPVPGPTLHNNQTGAVRVQIARLAVPLRLGRWTAPQPRVVFDPDIDDAFFGIGFLSEARVTFDGPNRRVALEHPGDDQWAVPDYITHGIGIAHDGGWRVTDVIPGTPAADAPVSIGDLVVAVNRVPAAELRKETWLQASRARAPLSIALRRGNSTQSLELPAVALPPAANRPTIDAPAAR